MTNEGKRVVITGDAKSYLKRIIITLDKEGKWSCDIDAADNPLLPRDVVRINRMLRLEQRLQYRNYHINRRVQEEALVSVPVTSEGIVA